jgi:hypothetical protein
MSQSFNYYAEDARSSPLFPTGSGILKSVVFSTGWPFLVLSLSAAQVPIPILISRWS